MKMLRHAVIGAGGISKKHFTGYGKLDNVKTVAVCDINETRLRAASETWGVPDITTDYGKILARDDIDLISICLPNYLHAPDGIAALDAGKHLILEKPAGITQEECDALYEAARKSDRKTVVSFLTRWSPVVRNLRKLLDQGAFGDIYYACADYWHGIKPEFASYNWIRRREFAGGAMITGGCHAVDIARYLNGDVAEVHAYSLKKRDDFDYDTTYVAAVRFVNGSIGKVSASLDGLNFPYQFNIDLLGTKGAARENRIYTKELLDNQHDWVTLPCATPNSGAVSHHPFKDEIDNFVDAIRENGKSLCTLEDACRTMDVVFAVTESARIGKPVAVKQR